MRADMESDIRKILEGVQTGEVSVEQAIHAIKAEPFMDIDYAKIDMHRKIRQGACEVIYGASKTPEQIRGISEKMVAAGAAILNAIKYHTVGRMNMTDLDKIIYLADMTEEGRSSYKGKDEIKRLAQYNLNRAMYKALVCSYNYVSNILKQEAHPITKELIAYYKQFDLSE